MSKNEYICDCNIIHPEAVTKALSKMPNNETFTNLAHFYKLIGDITRCKILFIISEAEMCVCDIANVLSMSKSSVSHQLGTLRKNGIVKCRKKGKEVYYTLDDEHVLQVFNIGLEHINHKKEENHEI